MREALRAAGGRWKRWLWWLIPRTVRRIRAEVAASAAERKRSAVRRQERRRHVAVLDEEMRFRSAALDRQFRVLAHSEDQAADSRRPSGEAA